METPNQHDPRQLQAANDIIQRHTLYAMGGSIIPIPLLDLAAVTAIQLDMVKTLSNLFGVDYSENSGKAVIASLTGSLFARVGASLLKAIPVFGSILGGVSLVALSGAATYALGQVYVRHVTEGGSLFDLNPDDYRDFFRQSYEQGKEQAEQWKKDAEQSAKPAARDIPVDFDPETGEKPV